MTLHDKVVKQCLSFPDLQMGGGPTFYLIMVQTITAMTEEGARAMTRQIKEMRILEYEGKDEGNIVSLL